MLPIKNNNFHSLIKGMSPQPLNNIKQKRELQLMEQSKELEKLFVTYLVKSMERTIPEGSLNSNQSNLASMFFSSVMADAIVEQGGFGLTKMIFQSLNAKEKSQPLDKNPLIDAFDLIKTDLIAR